MVKHRTGLDAVFAALADRTRRSILARLARGPASVGSLAAPQRMSWPAVTRHLRVLELAGLVSRTKAGRVHRMKLEEAALGEAQGWIERYARRPGKVRDAIEELLQQGAGVGDVRPRERRR